jgi:hypothetical protein
MVGLCERRGLEVENIEVYLDGNKTPLPLLTSDTSWLSGRTLRIRGEPLAFYNYLSVFVSVAEPGGTAARVTLRLS